MRRSKGSAPAAGGLAGAAQMGSGRGDRSSVLWPVALAVRKRGKACIVAKLIRLDGRPVLATVWRGQRGTEQAVSLPTVVLEYARRAGVERYYLRDDRQRRMWTCPLATFGQGSLRADGERYLPLSWLTETPWREWPYAERVVVLDDAEPEHTDGLRQLALDLGVAS